MASTVDKAQVIDAPESSIRPISPKKKLVALVALVLGVAIPAGLIYLLNLLRYRIEGRNDIEKLTDLSILADIFVAGELKEGQRAIVVRENTNDMMEETFRTLRTNLSFVVKRSEKVLLCTSMRECGVSEFEIVLICVPYVDARGRHGFPVRLLWL